MTGERLTWNIICAIWIGFIVGFLADINHWRHSLIWALLAGTLNFALWYLVDWRKQRNRKQ